MTQALTKKVERDTLEEILQRPAYASRFKQVLGDKASQFCSSLVSIGRSMPDVDPKSIIGSAMIAACLDLPIEKNLGFAWIVPYKKGDQKLAQFQVGFKGYVQLAQRTGYYAGMNACTINKEAYKGRDNLGEPLIDWDQVDETKPAVGYFFGFKMINGFIKGCYWTLEKVKAHAQRYSQSYRSGYDSPWKTHFDKMALKTVIANELSDWGILSVQFQLARRNDQAMVKDIDAEAEYIDTREVDQIGEGEPEKHKPEATGHEKATKGPKTEPEKAATKPQDAPKSQEATSTPPKAETQPEKAPVSETKAPEAAVAPTETQGKVETTAEPSPKAETTVEKPQDDDNLVFETVPPAGAAETPGKAEFAPNPQETPELQQVRRLLHNNGKTEADLISVLRKNKAMKEEQGHISELSTKKLENISIHWEGLMKLMATP